MNDVKVKAMIEALVDKIVSLESDKWIRQYEIDKLKEENARLNELLNPTKKVGEDE